MVHTLLDVKGAFSFLLTHIEQEGRGETRAVREYDVALKTCWESSLKDIKVGHKAQ